MPETDRSPDNTLTMEINGTTYIIQEFFDAKDSMDDVISKRIASDSDCSGIPNN